MRPRGAVALVAGAALLTGLIPAPASALGVSAAQVRSLAARADHGDSRALVTLRAVSTIDGSDAPLGWLLGRGSAAELGARLRVLAAPSPAVTASPVAAQRSAAAILGAARYGRPTVADPLLGLLDRLARALHTVSIRTPGGPPIFWAGAAILVLLSAGLGARRMLHGLGSAPPVAGDSREPPGESPESLQREASAAEQAGAFDTAVRLRFRAGLLALDARSVIDYRPSLLTTDVARRLDSERFDHIADTFNRVAYGHTAAAAEDARASREDWAEVLASSPERR